MWFGLSGIASSRMCIKGSEILYGVSTFKEVHTMKRPSQSYERYRTFGKVEFDTFQTLEVEAFRIPYGMREGLRRERSKISSIFDSLFSNLCLGPHKKLG